MTINLTKIMGSTPDMEKASAARVYFVPLENITPNKNNYFKIDESVESLALNIKTVGLLDPLCAVKRDQTTLLISGERRFRALSLLNSQGIPYSFNGSDISGFAPICYVKDDRHDLLIGAANAHRDMTKEEKNAAIDRMEEILEEEIREKRFTVPTGKRKASILAAMTGIKEHYVKDYLADKNRKAEETYSSHNSTSASNRSEDSESVKEWKALKSAFTKCIKSVENTDSNIISAMSDRQIQQLTDLKKYLLNLLTTISGF